MPTSNDTSKTAAATARSPAWRDIESAPKPDLVPGTPVKPIWLYFNNGGDSTRESHYTIGYWDSHAEGWVCLVHQGANWLPTHWQPVAPPRKYTLEHLLTETYQVWDQILDQWLADTEYMSSTTAMTRVPLFAELKEIGDGLGYHVLDRMEAGEVHVQFMVLLRQIFGTSPVKPEHVGIIKEMTKDWIQWYRQ